MKNLLNSAKLKAVHDLTPVPILYQNEKNNQHPFQASRQIGIDRKNSHTTVPLKSAESKL
jgi:hypothetical protein